MININIVKKLDDIEDKIENIKWLIKRQSIPRRRVKNSNLSAIQKSKGILAGNSPKGTVYENNVRKKLKASFSKRMKAS